MFSMKSIAVTLVMMLIIATPSIILAAVEGSSTGTFTVSNAAPTVSSVALWSTGGGAGATSSMTPQVQYNVKVAVTDNNSLNDLSTIKVYLYYDADGTYNTGSRPATGNTQNCAILNWANSGSWSMDPNASTTWSVVSGSCSQPSLTGSSGTFEFNFIPGKIATESPGAGEWHIYAVADDGTTTGDNYQEDREVDWYGEISTLSGTTSFGTVILGCTGSPSGSVSATYIANGAYDEQVKSDATWVGQTSSGTISLNTSGTSPATSEFAIVADDDATQAGSVQVLSAGYASIDESGTQTSESGDTQANNTMWLWLGSTGIIPEEYQGTINYQIINGS